MVHYVGGLYIGVHEVIKLFIICIVYGIKPLYTIFLVGITKNLHWNHQWLQISGCNKSQQRINKLIQLSGCDKCFLQIDAKVVDVQNSILNFWWTATTISILLCEFLCFCIQQKNCSHYFFYLISSQKMLLNVSFHPWAALYCFHKTLWYSFCFNIFISCFQAWLFYNPKELFVHFLLHPHIVQIWVEMYCFCDSTIDWYSYILLTKALKLSNINWAQNHLEWRYSYLKIFSYFYYIPHRIGT